jgi:hypothetical protein
VWKIFADKKEEILGKFSILHNEAIRVKMDLREIGWVVGLD